MSPDGLFFTHPIQFEQLFHQFGGTADDAAREMLVSRISPIELAGAGDIAPFLSRRYLKSAGQSPALLLTTPELAKQLPEGRRWIHPHASYVLAQLLAYIEVRRGEAQIHPTAVIERGAVVKAGVVIGEYSRIEPNAVLYGGSYLGARVIIGAGAVIGGPGFGFTQSPEGRPVRIPQLGGVFIDDDAEIGALCTIDAGTLAPTRIGKRTKLDAHVHVGHNGRIGDDVFIAAQAGFAGSADIGRGVRVGGQAGVADHVSVGERAQLAAKAGVIGDVPEGAVFAGYPAVERSLWLRGHARLYRLERKKRS